MNRCKAIPAHKGKRGLKFLLASALLLTLLVSGCSPVLDGYREFRVSRGIAAFSFEYPAGWQLAAVSTAADRTNVSICSRKVKAFCDFSRATSLNINILPVANGFADPRQALTRELAIWQTQPDFTPPEQTEVEIGGCRAQQLRFTCRYIYDGAARATGDLPEIIVRLIYFTFDGTTYGLEVISNPESLAKDADYIEHILRTFQPFEGKK